MKGGIHTKKGSSFLVIGNEEKWDLEITIRQPTSFHQLKIMRQMTFRDEEVLNPISILS